MYKRIGCSICMVATRTGEALSLHPRLISLLAGATLGFLMHPARDTRRWRWKQSTYFTLSMLLALTFTTGTIFIASLQPIQVLVESVETPATQGWTSHLSYVHVSFTRLTSYVLRRDKLARHDYRPLQLVAAAPPNETAEVRLNELLASVNGTLLGNPLTRKPFVLYRAIGNDLPPRHSVGQALANVRFMLENEPRFDDLDVRWYLNRIIRTTELLNIVTLLVQHNQTFTIDHFDFNAFARLDVRLNGFNPIDVLRGNMFYQYNPQFAHARREIKDSILSSLNHFIAHNNEARNAMLELGMSTGAKYILPWDGNCFLTTTAWRNLSRSVVEVLNMSESGDGDNRRQFSTRYFYVPMVRMTNNNLLLSETYVPTAANEEPQLVFRNDARERFNESLAYGCRPKVELLWRLRVPGWWSKLSSHPSSCSTYLRSMLTTDVPPGSRVAAAGWVARLFSGVAHLEVDGALDLRGDSRSDAIEAAAATVRATLARKRKRVTRDTLSLYNDEELNLTLAAFSMRDPRVERVISRLIAAADDTEKYEEHDAVGIGYAGVDKSIPLNRGLNAIERPLFAREAIILALAAYFTGESRRVGRAVSAVRGIFGATGLSFRDGRLFAEGGIDICLAIDAARLLRRAGVLPSDDILQVDRWVLGRSRWLRNSTLLYDASFNDGWRGTLHDVHAACVASFVDDSMQMSRHTVLARGRMLAHFDHQGAIKRDGLKGLVAWALLARVAEPALIDMWTFGHSPIHGGVAFLPNATRVALPVAPSAGAAEICAAVAVASMVEAGVARSGLRLPGRIRDKNVPLSPFDADECLYESSLIPPFWNLGV